MDQRELDGRIQDYYASWFDEASRLTSRSAAGRLEFERTQRLVRERIGEQSHILDIGGGAGIHAAELARHGHTVVLVDPVPAHVSAAAEIGTFEALLGDARELQFSPDAFDVALSFGPLYHLADRNERIGSLREAARVVRAGGWVFASAIPRIARLAALSLGRPIAHPYPAELVALLEDGVPASGGAFPGGHFHTSAELAGEMEAAGLTEVSVVGIEGPAGAVLEAVSSDDDDAIRAASLIAGRAEGIPDLADLSNHILAIGRV